MTMTEKILARASEKPQLSPDEYVWVKNVDRFILQANDIAVAEEGHCRPGEVFFLSLKNIKIYSIFCSFMLTLVLAS